MDSVSRILGSLKDSLSLQETLSIIWGTIMDPNTRTSESHSRDLSKFYLGQWSFRFSNPLVSQP